MHKHSNEKTELRTLAQLTSQLHVAAICISQSSHHRLASLDALQSHQANVRDPRGVKGGPVGLNSPPAQRQVSSPARTRSGSSNLATMPSMPSSGNMQRQPSSAGLNRQASSAALQRQLSNSLGNLLRQGSENSPALQRRSEQSPAPRRAAGFSPALQRPGTASSSATQRQNSGADQLNRLLSQGGLAALLRAASSPARQRLDPAAAERRGQSPAAQRQDSALRRQDDRGKAPARGSSPELRRASSSGTRAGQGQSRPTSAARSSSPGQRRQEPLPGAVVAADFARKASSNGLAPAASGDLAGRSERVSLSATSNLFPVLLQRACQHQTNRENCCLTGCAHHSRL